MINKYRLLTLWMIAIWVSFFSINIVSAQSIEPYSQIWAVDSKIWDSWIIDSNNNVIYSWSYNRMLQFFRSRNNEINWNWLKYCFFDAQNSTYNSWSLNYLYRKNHCINYTLNTNWTITKSVSWWIINWAHIFQSKIPVSENWKEIIFMPFGSSSYLNWQNWLLALSQDWSTFVYNFRDNNAYRVNIKNRLNANRSTANNVKIVDVSTSFTTTYSTVIYVLLINNTEIVVNRYVNWQTVQSLSMTWVVSKIIKDDAQQMFWYIRNDNKLISFTVWSSTTAASSSVSNTSTNNMYTGLNYASFYDLTNDSQYPFSNNKLITYFPSIYQSWLLYKSLNWSNFLFTNYIKSYNFTQFKFWTMPIDSCYLYDVNNNKLVANRCWTFVAWEQFTWNTLPSDWTWWTGWWTNWTWLWDVITDIWLKNIDAIGFEFDNQQNSWFCSEYSWWNINQYCAQNCSIDMRNICQKCATWLSPTEFASLYNSCNLPMWTWQFKSNNWDVVWYWEGWIVMYQKKDVVACNFSADWWCPENFDLLNSIEYITCRVSKIWSNISKLWKTFKNIFWIFIFQESNLVWQDVFKLNWVSFTLWNDWKRIYVYNTDASKLYSMLMWSIFTWWDILLAMYLWYNIIIFLWRKKEEKND